ncbi:hypothetical protein G6L37_07170 [Agrobacterium rubi]|nr:hypothetical protein [Agrobacterium rubi]NTF25147.1 hypothetical protein [Agrobacterium rubi]
MTLELDGRAMRIVPVADLYPEVWILQTDEIEVSAGEMFGRVSVAICLDEEICIQLVVTGGDYHDIGHPHNLRHERGVLTYQVIATMGLDASGRAVISEIKLRLEQINGKSFLFDHMDEWWAFEKELKDCWTLGLHGLIGRNPDFVRNLWSVVRGIVAEDMVAFIAEGDPTGSKTRYRDYVAMMPFLPGTSLKQIWGQLNGTHEFCDEIGLAGSVRHTGRVPWQCKSLRRKGMVLPSWS